MRLQTSSSQTTFGVPSPVEAVAPSAAAAAAPPTGSSMPNALKCKTIPVMLNRTRSCDNLSRSYGKDLFVGCVFGRIFLNVVEKN